MAARSSFFVRSVQQESSEREPEPSSSGGCYPG